MTKTQRLELINTKIDNCKKCSLCETALNPVYGNGNSDAEIVFIGEAPGANEDKLGLPFVGRSGKLLDSLLEKISLDRQKVWIGNIVKHRPPKNRDPSKKEISACENFLYEQLKVIEPKLIITLGRHALNFFDSSEPISKKRGILINAKGYNVYPIYHPAAGLRNGNMLKLLEKDFTNIPNVLKKIENKVE